MSKKAKKIVIIGMAMALMLTIGITGTLAYLTNTTDPVKNTFVAAGGGKLINDPANFELAEHDVTPLDNGAVVLCDGSGTTEEVIDEDGKIAYTVYPGVNLPKDPTVYIKSDALTEAKSMLFIEVVDETPAGLTCNIDPKWELVSGVAGNNGGKIYVYNTGLTGGDPYILSKTNNASIGTEVASGKAYAGFRAMNVLKDNRVIVANNTDNGANSLETLGFSSKDEVLNFDVYSFLCQASATSEIGDAATTPKDVIVACGFAAIPVG